jgi:SAM-dependent methyltransferase
MQRQKQPKLQTSAPDIEQYYRRLVSKYPGDPRSDGYSHPIAQEVRYEAYLSHFDLNRSTLLDVGCGSGQMLRYLTRRAVWPARYVGIDFIPEKIRLAKESYESDGFLKLCRAYGVDVHLEVGTVEHIRDLFQYVIACSVFDVKQTDVPTTFKFACSTMSHMWSRATVGIGIDFFSPYALEIQPFNAPIPPEWVFTWAKLNLNERVLLDYTYAPHDYMLIVRKGDSPFTALWKAEGGWSRETGGEHD